ncbi:bridging integrator 3 [Anaeramoeba flamelloides]|uniref:Bridging integrator 3 n=1 Tax=Anaeramoeba flamelloides TaxID=1746091 RepID=A0ABQ8Y4Z8_9EUKA|nr:bridging integrator 3 [Anaeramoeba flamelloides]
MSFNRFKQNINRLQQKALVKMGTREKTVDVDFDKSLEKYHKVKHNYDAIYKEVLNVRETMVAFLEASKRLSNEVADFYDNPKAKMRLPALKYQTSMSKLAEETIQLFDERTKDLTVSPLLENMIVFNDLNPKIKNRNNALVDYDRSNRKVTSLTNKKNSDPLKLSKAQNELKKRKKRYEKLNNDTKSQIDSFYLNRFKPVDSPMAVFISTFGGFMLEIGKHSNELMKVIPKIDSSSWVSATSLISDRKSGKTTNTSTKSPLKQTKKKKKKKPKVSSSSDSEESSSSSSESEEEREKKKKKKKHHKKK